MMYFRNCGARSVPWRPVQPAKGSTQSSSMELGHCGGTGMNVCLREPILILLKPLSWLGRTVSGGAWRGARTSHCCSIMLRKVVFRSPRCLVPGRVVF
ncbi:hypothetical protein PR202_gb27321 [Eleusine coracana subsp. coracana]|uniref:Uncharacterized protein n=1 Tax=Eleusine coracana subsp. coracana TaxID=191504 RepID=A0AAV5FRC2_ELECO|nr:hypothetical protein PR202_gb27321 [Eleusine coracana subsp. coracana]